MSVSLALNTCCGKCVEKQTSVVFGSKVIFVMNKRLAPDSHGYILLMKIIGTMSFFVVKASNELSWVDQKVLSDFRK